MKTLEEALVPPRVMQTIDHASRTWRWAGCLLSCGKSDVRWRSREYLQTISTRAAQHANKECKIPPFSRRLQKLLIGYPNFCRCSLCLLPVAIRPALAQCTWGGLARGNLRAKCPLVVWFPLYHWPVIERLYTEAKPFQRLRSNLSHSFDANVDNRLSDEPESKRCHSVVENNRNARRVRYCPKWILLVLFIIIYKITCLAYFGWEVSCFSSSHNLRAASLIRECFGKWGCHSDPVVAIIWGAQSSEIMLSGVSPLRPGNSWRLRFCFVVLVDLVCECVFSLTSPCLTCMYSL